VGHAELSYFVENLLPVATTMRLKGLLVDTFGNLYVFSHS